METEFLMENMKSWCKYIIMNGSKVFGMIMGAGGKKLPGNERIGSRAFRNMSKLPLEPNIRGERAI